MATEDNEATVRRWMEEGWNRGNVAVFDELSAPNWIIHDPNLPQVRTLEDYKRWASETRNAFPDLQGTIDDLIAEGDQVVVRYTIGGTHRGDFMGMPPTGKQVSVSGIAIIRFTGSKGVEVWQVGDTLGMLQQLGVVPAMGEAR